VERQTLAEEVVQVAVCGMWHSQQPAAGISSGA